MKTADRTTATLQYTRGFNVHKRPLHLKQYDERSQLDALEEQTI